MSHAAPRSRALHVTLWVVQVLLAAFFLMAGANHGLKPIAEAAQSSPWITGVPEGLARFIGLAVYQYQGTAGNVPLAAAFAVVPIVIMGVYLAVARRMGAFDAL